MKDSDPEREENEWAWALGTPTYNLESVVQEAGSREGGLS